MESHKKVLLTFDFELFLGSKSGSVEKCMLEPTLELMKVVKKHELSTVFFVDTLYLYKLKEAGKTNDSAFSDYKKILELLKSCIEAGGYVFYHLHPHWLDAVYLEEINQWDVSCKDKFALNNLSEQELADVFSYSHEIISEIYQDKPLPKCFGFRAGGLYAQPFSYYRTQMRKFDILLDFSVLRNAKSTGGNQKYSFDYSVCPNEDIYPFSDEVNIKDDKGEFTEIRMDQFQLAGINKIINGIYYRQNHKKESWKRWGDGASSGNVVKSTQKVNKLKNEESFSIELLNNFKAKLYSKQMKRENFMHIISHPKLFSPANIEAFDRFITNIKSKYTLETDVFKIIETNLNKE